MGLACVDGLKKSDKGKRGLKLKKLTAATDGDGLNEQKSEPQAARGATWIERRQTLTGGKRRSGALNE